MNIKDPKPKKKMPGWQKGIIIGALVLIGLLIVVGVILYSLFDHYYDMTNYVPLDSTEEIIYDIATEEEETWDPSLIPGDEDTSTVPDTGTSTPITDPSSTPNVGIPSAPSTDPSSTPVTDSPTTATTPQTTPQTTPVTTPGTTRPSLKVDPPKTIPGDNVEYKRDVILANAMNDYRMEFGSHIKNILLIGDDGYDGSTARRSDSIMIISINEKTGQIVVTSLPRDMYVYIPGLKDAYCFNRINAAYAHGGVSMLINTIEVNFKIKIDKYARLNFSSFIRVIDIIGGVDVTLSEAEINYMTERGSPLPAGTKPGLVHLDGAQALNYCRCRHVGKRVGSSTLSGDFARTYRQREVMTILFNNLKKMSISDINELLESILPQITHNFTKSEVLAYIADVPKYIKYEIVTQQILAAGGWSYTRIDSRSVYRMDYERCWKFLEKKINGE